MKLTRNLYTLYFSIIPLVTIYTMPGTSLSLATVLTIIGTLYCVMALFFRKMVAPLWLLCPFVIYIAYIITKSSVNFAFLSIAVLFQIFAIGTALINVSLFRKTIEFVALVASICVIFQQVVHLTTGLHFSFLLNGLIRDDLQIQYKDAINGIFEGMYRPSAFFLEPAHFTQYCIMGLESCMFSNNVQTRKALLISLGLIATTSGLGFVLAFAIWAWWYIFRKRFSVSRVFIIVVLLIILFIILDHISFTHNIINRFTVDPESGEKNAINGRLWWWNYYFGNFSVSEFMFGFGLESLPDDAYFTGIMKQLYCYGIVGLFLLFVLWLTLFVKSNSLGKVLAGSYFGLMFFAELTGYDHLLFYLGTYLLFIVNDYNSIVVVKKRNDSHYNEARYKLKSYYEINGFKNLD